MRTKFIRLGVCLILCLPLCVALGYLGSFFVPRQYCSKVLMEVEPDECKIEIFFNVRDAGLAKPPEYYFESIRSREVLYPVIDQLYLVKKWSGGGAMLSEEQVYIKLLKMMVLKELRNTGLLEIGVYSTDPQEAADIANVTAVQFRNWFSEDLKKTLARDLSKLKDETDRQRKKVDEVKAGLVKIAQINHIPEADTDPAQDRLKARFDWLRSEEKGAQAHVTELTARLDQIAKMTPDDVTEANVAIINAAPMDILHLYRDTKVKEHALIKGGVAEDDTGLKDLRSREEVYRNQLQERIDWTKRSLTASLPIAQDDLKQRETAVSDAANSFHGSGSPEYLEAKDKYFEEKKKLDEAETRLATQKMELQIGVWTAKIWEKAERADHPARPNVPMILLVSASIGMLFAIPGVVLLIVGLRMKEA